MRPDGIAFPNLAPPYHEALQECVDFLFSEYDVAAIIASGTIIRGEGDKRSDIDMCVVHRGLFRERDQRFFRGVPFEIFVNPQWKVRRYFEEELPSRRPVTAHMFATGYTVHDPEGIAASLVQEARAVLARIPEPDKAHVVRDNYFAATMFEDAEDLFPRDRTAAALLLGPAVYELVKCRLSQESGWIPRHKEFLNRLREIDPESGKLAREALEAEDLVLRFYAAKALCERVTGSTGFFEWTSGREDLPADSRL